MTALTRFRHRCFAKFLTLIVLVLMAVPVVQADDLITKPSRAQKRVGMLVAQLMSRSHLSRRELDSEISNRAFDLYLERLDPTKSYFMQSDVDEFSVERDQIANLSLIHI